MRTAVLIGSICAAALAAGCGQRAQAPQPQPRAALTPAPTAPAEPPTALAPPSDAETSSTGLVSKVLVPGSGERRPTAQDKVRVDFVAWNAKGEESDSSKKRGGPETFALSGVIAGWSEALQNMHVGERRRIWVPDHLTYPGRPGYPRPPAVFELELLEILPGKAPADVPSDLAHAPADATRTPSGLAYKLLKKTDSSERPSAWDRVSVLYTGWTLDGTQFESTRDKPAIFDVASVMPGWQELLPKLAVGESARVWLPPALAYQGRKGRPEGEVVFDLELISVERRPEPPRAPRDVASVPPDARRTKSGLAYRVLKYGSGKSKPDLNAQVKVHYSA